MRSLHELKSFHENALSEWNATALIMKEAMKGEADTRKAFVEVVLALADMAGKDATKRKNLIKAGHIILHSMSDGSQPKTPPPLPQNPPKKPDCWKGVRRVLVALCVLVLCAGSFAGGFALNMPNVASSLPRLITTNIPTSTPEQVIQQLMIAIHHDDKPAVIALYHPERRKDLSGYHLEAVDKLHNLSIKTGQPLTTKIESVQEEATAKVILTIQLPDGKTRTGTMRLRKFENTWYIDSMDD